MDTQSLDSIAHFCIDQHSAFDANAWIRRGAADGKLVAVAAKFLSTTNWFGNKASLESIATQIHPDVDSITKFNRDLRAIGKDLTLFSQAVRSGIAAKQLASSVDPGKAPASDGYVAATH